LTEWGAYGEGVGRYLASISPSQAIAILDGEDEVDHDTHSTVAGSDSGEVELASASGCVLERGETIEEAEGVQGETDDDGETSDNDGHDPSGPRRESKALTVAGMGKEEIVGMVTGGTVARGVHG
jgi:hypothetical protein